MNKALKNTLNLFNLTKIDANLFVWDGTSTGYGRIFGGQVMAQCLMAAYNTIQEKRYAHSFHSYFLRPGDIDNKIVFDVDRIRDRKSFTTRRVRATQGGEAIFNCSISFKVKEKGLSHQAEMPNISGPDDLESESEMRKRIKNKIDKKFHSIWLREREIEMRQVEPIDYLNPKKAPPIRNTWMKPNGRIPKDQKINQALLLYVSDMGLLGTAVNPHGLNFMSSNFQSASLDHAMWFHNDIEFNDWHLYSMESPISGGARGFSLGSIFTQSGQLVASTAQEGLMRLWKNKK